MDRPQLFDRSVFRAGTKKKKSKKRMRSTTRHPGNIVAMITSTANQQVKNILQLQKKARARQAQGLYVVEGVRMVSEAPRGKIRSIYVSESFAKDAGNQEWLAGRRFEILSDPVFAHVSDTKTPQGILCLMEMPDHSLRTLPEVLSDQRSGLWLLLEQVQDPGNLGTMFRTAEGAGAAGVIMDSRCADIFHPKTIRSTMGSLYRVPFWITPDLAVACDKLKKNGVPVYAAHLAGERIYDEPDYTGGCAFLIGNEGNGLSREAAALADELIRIPMEGQLESLNAAMAVGILLYEANRQSRSASGRVKD